MSPRQAALRILAALVALGAGVAAVLVCLALTRAVL
jgi:hypothetical protein